MNASEFLQDFITPATDVSTGVWLVVCDGDKEAHRLMIQYFDAVAALTDLVDFEDLPLARSFTHRALRLPSRELRVVSLAYPEDDYRIRGLSLTKVFFLERVALSDEAVDAMLRANVVYRSWE